MKRIQLLLVLPLFFYGCALTETQNKTPETQASMNGLSVAEADNTTLSFKPNQTKENALYNQPALDRNINFYVRGMMQDLIGNLQFVSERTPVAVTSFVLLDSDLQETNLLGNQIAESLIHEIHKFGIPVLDFKTSSSIQTNEHGDYVFSRDPKNNSHELPVHYVFAGTLVKHQGGYLVNARVIGLNSKAVVASAQSFIPAKVSNALIEQKSKKENTKARKSIQLVQGS